MSNEGDQRYCPVQKPQQLFVSVLPDVHRVLGDTADLSHNHRSLELACCMRGVHWVVLVAAVTSLCLLCTAQSDQHLFCSVCIDSRLRT